jgi:RNA ligase
MSKITKIHEILDGDKLARHIIDGYVNVQHHPTLPLRILNYSQSAQYAGLWGDGTIDFCRGLIIDDENNIVARGFKKFHNFNTSSIPETLEENLPKTTPTITEKIDGSLGIYFSFEGEWGIATRGSFTSDQAKWAMEYYKRGIGEGYLNTFQTQQEYTPLFEIVYDRNRIVCKYDWEGLIVLAMINKQTGAEMNHDSIVRIGQENGFRVVRQYKLKNLQDCLSENEKNREGYVVSYPIDSNKPPVKVKIKFADYVRLHKIVTGVSPKAIWELCSLGKKFDGLDECSDDFQKWANQWVEKLREDYGEISLKALQVYSRRPEFTSYIDERAYRAACAEYFLKTAPEISNLLFSMLDGKNTKAMIWKMIKPRGDDRSFREDGV